MTIHSFTQVSTMRLTLFYVLGKQSRHSLSLVFTDHSWLFCGGKKLWRGVGQKISREASY